MRALLTSVALLAMASHARAGLLVYDGFEYPVGTNNLPGQVNVAASATWTAASAPAGSAAHSIAAGSVEYPSPSLQPSPGNRLQLPRAASSQNRATRINLPSGPVTNGSLFFSFTLQLNGWANLNATQSRQGNNYQGGIIAGFHAGTGTDTMSPTLNYGTQLRVLRYVDSSVDPTTTQVQRYHLGVIKNTPTAGGSWYGADSAGNAGDLSKTFGLNDKIFVVGEYKFVAGASNDETRIWINPAPGDVTQYLSPTVPVITAPAGVADPAAAQIGSFYFFSDTLSGGNFAINEVRIGTTYADVTPIPEPSTLALTFVAWTASLTLRPRR